MDKEVALYRDYLFFLKTLRPGARITLVLTTWVGDKDSEVVGMLCRLFETLEHLLVYGHKLWVSIKGWPRFEVKKEELARDCWMAKFAAHTST
jgi:hypothetical protein